MGKFVIRMVAVIAAAGLILAGCTPAVAPASEPEPELFTVTFNAGEGGTVNPGSIKVTPGGTADSLPEPTNEDSSRVFWG